MTLQAASRLDLSRVDALRELDLDGTPRDADIRSAFRRKAKKLHADLGADMEDALRRLITARDHLISDALNHPAPLNLIEGQIAEVSLPVSVSIIEAVKGGDIVRDLPALEMTIPSEELTSLTQTVAVRIAVTPGLRHGEHVRLMTPGMSKPDHLFHILIENDPEHQVWGDDIWMTAQIEPRLFQLGGRTQIETPHGPLDIEIEQGFESGSSLTLPGLGLPATEKRPAGNLQVRLEPRIIRTKSYTELLSEFRGRWIPAAA